MSERAEIERGPGGRFLPGKSPNPGGRPARLSEVLDLARDHTAEAIEGLLEIARSPRAPAVARVRAWEIVLDRAWGRPPQNVSLDVPQISRAEEALADLSDEELRALASAAAAEARGLPAGKQ